MVIGVRPSRRRVAQRPGVVAVVVARANRSRKIRSSRFPRGGHRRAARRRRLGTIRRRAADDAGHACASAIVRPRPRFPRRRDCHGMVRAHRGARRAAHPPRVDFDTASCLVRRGRDRVRRHTRGRLGHGWIDRLGSGRRGRRGRRGALGHGRRRRGRFRYRVWCGRRLGRRRREVGAPRRKEGQRVDVGLGRTDADAQMDVWNGVLGLARGAGLGKGVTLRDDVAAADEQRAQVGERNLGAANGDRHRQAVRRNGAGERHLPRDRSADRTRHAERHVDSAMLAGGVRVPTDRETTEDLTVGRPCPGERGRSRHERPDENEAESGRPPRCPLSEHGSTVPRDRPGGNAP